MLVKTTGWLLLWHTVYCTADLLGAIPLSSYSIKHKSAAIRSRATGVKFDLILCGTDMLSEMCVLCITHRCTVTGHAYAHCCYI